MISLDKLKHMKSAARKMDFYPTRQMVHTLLDAMFDAHEKLADQHVYAVKEFTNCGDETHGYERGTLVVKLFSTEAEAQRWALKGGRFDGYYIDKMSIHASAKDAGW